VSQLSNLDFDQALNQLRSEFKSGAYTANRVEMIWNHVRDLQFHEFQRIVNHFIATRRQHDPPLPKDFADAARKEREAKPKPRVVSEPHATKCSTCRDIGVVRMLRDDLSTLGKCSCSQGSLQPWLIPVAQKMHGFSVTFLPWEPFKPDIPDLPEPQTHDQAKRFERIVMEAITEKQVWWREKVRVAEAFWKEELKGEPI
jgi:hypothetical protein